MPNHRYAEYRDEYDDYEPAAPEVVDDYDAFDDYPAPRGIPRLLSALGGLTLTPIGLSLLAWGGLRQQQLIQATANPNRDNLSIALVAGGALLLLAVAALGAASASGPIIGGLIWGVAPGIATLAVPQWGFHLVNLMPKSDIAYGLMDLLFIGGLLGIGFLLIGTGLASALVRRRRS